MWRAFALVVLAALPCTAHGANFAARADQFIRTQAALGRFTGTVAISVRGKLLLRSAYGDANREEHVPLRPSDEFEIASISKTFTAAAVATLVSERRLSLSDRVTDRLPIAPPSWSDVTIEDLLSHQSGIPEFTSTTNSFRALMRTERSPNEIVQLIDRLPLAFAPGKEYRYTNSDFLILAMIVEQVSGEPFEKFVAEHFLGRLGLRHTGFLRTQQLIPRRAYGYMRNGRQWTTPFPIDPSMLFGAGAIYSNVDDLLKWDKALHDDEVLPRAIREEFFKDRGHGYALGFFVDRIGGHPYVGHGGNLPGFSTDLEYFPDARLTVILLSNSDSAPVEEMTRTLAGMFFGDPARRPSQRDVRQRSNPSPARPRRPRDRWGREILRKPA